MTTRTRKTAAAAPAAAAPATVTAQFTMPSREEIVATARRAVKSDTARIIGKGTLLGAGACVGWKLVSGVAGWLAS